MQSNTMRETVKTAAGRLRLFILYADFPAGISARRAARRIASMAGPTWDATLEMWKLDSVPPVGPMRNMITQGAAEADILLVAVSAADRRDLTLNSWLDSLVHWKRNRLCPGYLVGLLGGGEEEVHDASGVVRDLASFADRTGMDWTWQPGADGTEDFRWIAGQVSAWVARRKV